ncbi:MFS transporter [Kineococcus rubinsiae]|uniref:MFS transporter n=1 Tax=Kineococcus rubinsiae TaxID=2609562 RepID=UPI001431408E|nr:MFS transporter [Kineococcus rubinsiae]NIZ90825.1 MFS transporter [Kineococcus rubinsiae]
MTVPAPAGEAGQPPGPLSRQHRRTTLSVVAFITLVAFESMAVATAMPVAASDLGGVRSYGLAFSSFLTASLLGTVVAGPWGDARGPRAPLAAGAALFTAGQLTCALAPTFSLLLLGRLLAGAGGGLVVVALYVVVGAAFSDALRPKVFGYMSAAWVLPAIVGPTLAGWMADAISWRSVFGVVVPLGVAVAAVILPRVPAKGTGSFEATARRRVLRGALLAVGAGALQVGAESLSDGGAWPVVLTVAGATLVVAALPGLLPRGTLRAARGLPSVIGVRGLYTAAFFGTESFVPLFLVTERGLAPAEAGLALTGGAIGWFAGTSIQTRDLTRMPRHLLLVAGGAVIALGIGVLVAVVLSGISGWFVLLVWLIAGCGMGIGMATTSVLTLRMAPPEERGLASSALQLSDNLGGVLGIAVVGAVFAALHTGAGGQDDLFAGMFAGLLLVAVLAAVVGSRGRAPRRSEPAPATSATVLRP